MGETYYGTGDILIRSDIKFVIISPGRIFHGIDILMAVGGTR